ncbi:hypothetical protein [Sinorhizobium mexicanum]|uniref:hypothetical protein n=1 Tax=Sinorhizobium mexicanum TaxID=375549 RepID=UPI001D8DF0E4|nr:putative pyridoxine 5'-phosphate oxidase superfamily flavin-nucleotide-binding protein [Sinorhizobium mexicanum]
MLKVVDDRTLTFAEYRRDRRYISVGNLAADGRACLFLMDHPYCAGSKIYVHVEAVAFDAEPALAELVEDRSYKAKIERIFRLRLKDVRLELAPAHYAAFHGARHS